VANDNDLSTVATEFRRHFDQYYLGVIPRLLNEEGLFLSFVSMLTAVETLAGTYAPNLGSGKRFKTFVSEFFPDIYHPIVDQLWEFRNHMIHSFNPVPFLLVCHQSRMHLCPANGVHMLNAEDFYADLLGASRLYFRALYSSPELQARFAKRVSDSDGGRIRSQQVIESV
jgi:hypothetical protein